MTTIHITVMGKPSPAGSKRGWAIKKGGVYTGKVAMQDACKKGKPHRKVVQDAARKAYNGKPLLTPLKMDITFFVQRPKNHSGKHGLKPSAPEFPTTRPDCLKLARHAEDSLTGIIYKDDSKIVTEIIRKRYASEYRTEITITEEFPLI